MIRPRKSLFITFQTLRQHLRGASDQHSRRDGAAGPKEEQKDQHRSRHPRRMAASERPQTRTGCPKPDRAPCAKHTDRTEFRWCIELVKEPCQQMSSGNREAPVFPLHAGFAILPCLIAKTVINICRQRAMPLQSPTVRKGKKSCPISIPAQGQSQCERAIDTSTGSGLQLLLEVLCLPGRIFQAVPLKKIQRQLVFRKLFFVF